MKREHLLKPVSEKISLYKRKYWILYDILYYSSVVGYWIWIILSLFWGEIWAPVLLILIGAISWILKDIRKIDSYFVDYAYTIIKVLILLVYLITG